MGDKLADPLESTLSSEGHPAPQRGREGQRVAHYLIGAPLGEGGMGVVYRASDEKLGRPVAIKFLQRSDDQSRARFLREARAASALDHPNIGTVYEIGEADGAPYIVMALYEGETLRARIRRGKLGEDEVVAIAKQLASALQAAHAAGIVHRDLKPANVMLLPDGTVKLLDFGLAKLTSIDESSLTGDGAILGTLAYMAPEQLKSAEVDARADLWALGAVLHEMISGEPPFGSGPAATIVGRVLSEKPKPLPSSTPPDLAQLTVRLLQRVPQDRLSSASEIVPLLERRTAPPPARANRRILIGGSIVALVAACAFAIALRPPSGLTEQTRSEAVRIYAQATQLYGEKRFLDAAHGFERAFELVDDPTLLYNIAQAYRGVGDPAKAGFYYRKYLSRLPDDPSKLTDDQQQTLAEFEQLLGARPSPAP